MKEVRRNQSARFNQRGDEVELLKMTASWSDEGCEGYF